MNGLYADIQLNAIKDHRRIAKFSDSTLQVHSGIDVLVRLRACVIFFVFICASVRPCSYVHVCARTRSWCVCACVSVCVCVSLSPCVCVCGGGNNNFLLFDLTLTFAL